MKCLTLEDSLSEACFWCRCNELAVSLLDPVRPPLSLTSKVTSCSFSFSRALTKLCFLLLLSAARHSLRFLPAGMKLISERCTVEMRVEFGEILVGFDTKDLKKMCYEYFKIEKIRENTSNFKTCQKIWNIATIFCFQNCLLGYLYLSYRLFCIFTWEKIWKIWNFYVFQINM